MIIVDAVPGNDSKAAATYDAVITVRMRLRAVVVPVPGPILQSNRPDVN